MQVVAGLGGQGVTAMDDGLGVRSQVMTVRGAVQR
jgi:hypothetical protein